LFFSLKKEINFRGAIVVHISVRIFSKRKLRLFIFYFFKSWWGLFPFGLVPPSDYFASQ
jgi:hypothetical protein